MLAHPLTQYMLCSPGEGAAALVVCRGECSSGCRTRARCGCEAASFRTRRPGSFEVFSPSLELEIAPSPTVDAAREAFEVAGIAPSEVDVVQVQDTESGAELIHLAECGLCEHGEQAELYAAGGDPHRRRRLPVNTDGGCLANGEPVGASGLRQVYEIVSQLRRRGRRTAGAREPARRVHACLRRAGVSACTVLSR